MSRIACLFLAVSLAYFVNSCGAGKLSSPPVVTKVDTVQTKSVVVVVDTVPAKAVAAPPTKTSFTRPTTPAYFVTMPESTAISVTLVDSIDTDVQLPGAIFRAKLSEPVIVDGYTLFADGAAARGVLSNVIESGRLKTPAELDFSLTAIQDGEGRWVDVTTQTIMEKKGSHTVREVAMIGGGAIVGGIIGRVIDRKGSTEIGAATGAAAGVGLSAATGKQDIFHGVGTEVTFFSSRLLYVNVEHLSRQPVVTAVTAVAPAVYFVTMPESTAITVTLVDSIDTDVQLSGATFRAALSQPVIVEGHTLFANGAAARGVLSNVVESGRLKTPAEMDFSLTAIQDGEGQWVEVVTNTISEKKGSHTTREVAMIGGGAIVGGILGRIIDKKGSTEIGTAAGAAAGVGLSAATGKQDIFHGVGTEITFFSSRAMLVATK